MTVDTDRYPMWFLLPKLAPNDLTVYIFDPDMAGHAGPGHIPVGNTGTRVGMWQNVVGGVATRTDGGCHQSFSVQALAVNRLRVVLEYAVLGDVVDELDFGSFLVTAHTEGGNVGHIGLRSGVVRATYVMLAVAVLAARRQAIPARHGQAVQALVELLLLHEVTGAAVDRLQLIGVREVLRIYVRVAKRAADVVVR
jgi:hypothetical protein